MKTLYDFLTSLGLRNQQHSYVARQVRIFNSLNLFAFINGILRWGYIVFISQHNYSGAAELINFLPVVLSLIMMLSMYASRLALTAIISFTIFPPVLFLVSHFSGDQPASYYLLLYFIYSFFFLHKKWHIVLAFANAFICFLFTQDLILPINPAELPGSDDTWLIYLDYIMLMILSFGCLFSIRDMLRKYQRNLRRQHAELHELIRFRDKIFSIVTHDMRTPLAATAQLVDLLEYTDLEKDELQGFITELKSNLSSTRSMMDNMLIWAKSQLKEEQVQRQLVPLAQLGQEVLRNAAAVADKKNIEIYTSIDPQLSVTTDWEMLNIITTNLVSNALKFTGEGGCICISASLEKGTILLSVADNGVGIPFEKQPMILGKDFYTSVGTNKEMGSGLGLKICSDLAKKCGATLEFESEPGKGTTFFLRFEPREIEHYKFQAALRGMQVVKPAFS